MSYFKGMKVTEPTYRNLGSGMHLVKMTLAEETNSFVNFDGTLKAKLPKWSDPTPQIVCRFAGEDGSIFHRFNGAGYRRFDELSEEEIKSGKYSNVDGYACTTKNGKFYRVQDPDRTEQAISILSQALMAFGVNPDTDIIEAFEQVIADSTEINIRIEAEVYNGKDQYEVTQFWPATSNVASADEGDLPY